MKKVIPTRYDIVEFSKSEHSLERIRSNDGGADPLSPVPSQNSCRKQQPKYYHIKTYICTMPITFFKILYPLLQKQCGSCSAGF